MKNLIVIIVLALANSVSAQVSVIGGGSMLMGFTRDAKPWGGFHLGVEIPRDDAVTLYARFTHHFKQYLSDSILPSDYIIYTEPKDLTSGLLGEYIGALPSMNYTMLEGGTRYYLGNGFDYGFSAYGGTNLMLIFNKVKANYQSFDESVYRINDASRIDGSIFSIGFGLGGGVKYTFPRLGTLYTDVSINYMIFAQPSSTTIAGNLYSPLIFNFNLGYRRDLIW